MKVPFKVEYPGFIDSDYSLQKRNSFRFVTSQKFLTQFHISLFLCRKQHVWYPRNLQAYFIYQPNITATKNEPGALPPPQVSSIVFYAQTETFWPFSADGLFKIFRGMVLKKSLTARQISFFVVNRYPVTCFSVTEITKNCKV